MELEKNNQKFQCKTIMAGKVGISQSSARIRKKKIEAMTTAEEIDNIIEYANLDVDDDGGGAEIERKLKVLQSLVPGGESMEMETLFEGTADYIEQLRGKVMVMRGLVQFIDAVAREEKGLTRR